MIEPLGEEVHHISGNLGSVAATAIFHEAVKAVVPTIFHVIKPLIELHDRLRSPDKGTEYDSGIYKSSEEQPQNGE